jgi:hypothetical protein
LVLVVIGWPETGDGVKVNIQNWFSVSE